MMNLIRRSGTLFLPNLVNAVKWMYKGIIASYKNIKVKAKERLATIFGTTAENANTTAKKANIIQSNLATMQGWRETFMEQARTMWTGMSTGATNLFNMAKQTQIGLGLKNAAVMAKEGIKAAFSAGKQAASSAPFKFASSACVAK